MESAFPTPVIQSLSALQPIEFAYKFNKEETFSKNLNLFKNGFRYYEHEAFKQFKDVALSKKNCLILTDKKSLKEVFETDSKQLTIGKISGSLFLKTQSNNYLTELNNNIYVGGIGKKLFVTVVPVSENTVELKIGKTKHIQIDAEYPYTARISEEILTGEDLVRQRFEIDYSNNLLTIKTKTSEGYRFLSYGVDMLVRAVGLELNEKKVNPYHFIPTIISSNEFYYNFDAKTEEIKYYNEMINNVNGYNVNIKETNIRDTSLLVTCCTTEIALSGKAMVNISLTKTNFSSSGSYSSNK